MYGVYLLKLLFTKLLLAQILEILMVNKFFVNKVFISSSDFSRQMTNHPEIKNVLPWKFPEKSEIP